MIIKSVKLKNLLFFIAVTLIIGFGGGLLGGNVKQAYAQLVKPPLAPPQIIFPIVWILLYILIGAAAYLISSEHGDLIAPTLKLYWLNIIANALWPVFFWRFKWLDFSAIWIGILIILTVLLILRSVKISKTAALLFIPYLIWLIFALYLNIGYAVLN